MPKPLDAVVLEFTKRAFPEGGFYVEAGGHDGIFQSNTHALDKSKWTGLLIEPSPLSYEKLVANRPEALHANVALVETEEITLLKGTFNSGSPMASAHPELLMRDSASFTRKTFIKRVMNKFNKLVGRADAPELVSVPAKTLDNLFSELEITKVDLFSLDVEGLEIQVLNGFSFNPKPRAFIIETRSSDASTLNEIMLANGYVLAANLSNFHTSTHPNWTGDHQDYLWVSCEESAILEVACSGHFNSR